ncbi:MAG: DNA mismatch repair protein MutS [candidate division WOR-3 bacterium]|nr:MAG: DNA mismatch repair protein MutS [candidate division WOR-3 bacterium]
MHLTPLLEQYQKIKNKYKGVLLLFRVGDFYEFYYDDAKLASSYLGITLTSKTISKGTRVPLAGVPIKAADGYIAKLVKHGLKVAICEQLEPATKGKKLVARDVIEVITPGTILRPSLLDATKTVFLAACLPDDKHTGIAFCDLTSGEFSCGEVLSDQLSEILLRREVKEVVIPEGVELGIEQTVTELDGFHFVYEIAHKMLLDHFHVVALDGFGIEEKKLGIAAAGALLYYVSENQKVPLTHIDRISLFQTHESLYLDSTTRRNLEILENIHGEHSRTLLGILDNCMTSFGKRRLRRELNEPLVDRESIEQRLDSVEEMRTREYLREELRNVLKTIQDVERITARLACQRILPRELVALKESLSIYPNVKELIEGCESEKIAGIYNAIGDFGDIVKTVDEALVPSPPATLEEGGIIKEGYSEELDELRAVARGGKKWLLEFEESERKRTGISSLKVSYNSVFGYFVEVTKPNLHLVPPEYIRKQTLTNVERYYTVELKSFEEKILGAEEKTRAIEYDLYTGIREHVAKQSNAILETTRAIAFLDVLQSFAHNAAINNYSRPVVTDDRRTVIKDGRHPVVEKILERGSFIPNDTYVDRERNQIIIITGPNMAGKSTYLRQVALITIMAQLGSFVPAKEASIGLVDKIFTRIGASDDISRGVSTFLAEMMETANILNNVSDQSLVILDEVGRGTSTYDGLALAWSVVEYLHTKKKPRTLFATHFHELTRIEDFLKGVKNYNFLVKEWGDEVIFLRKLSAGPSDQSYGIQVARLAGLPDSVIQRAKEVLRDFEEGEVFSMRKMKKTKLSQQDLFVDRSS